MAGYRTDTSPYVVDDSRNKWAWLQSLAHLFVLKRGIKLARLSLWLFGRLLIFQSS